ncbi:putative pseudouridine synthase [Mycobacterium xenopi 4042]|uniref:Putative pseudouridine synthase n=1 Tax=Mycobacterium xenopi 4042 TaxID=1299334 RepID=X7YQT7_MYCXE|nr:putative pseudouridine synthase [Mycobacterium xenopi 4042]
MTILYADDDIVAVDKPPGWPRMPRWVGPGRRCSVAWPPLVTGSPRQASTSGRASCIALTSAPQG